MSETPEKLRNLGPVSRGWLAEIGVVDRAGLEAMGVVEAYLRVEERHPRKVSLVLLWALWGAVHDVDWRDVSDATKAELKNLLDRP